MDSQPICIILSSICFVIAEMSDQDKGKVDSDSDMREGQNFTGQPSLEEILDYADDLSEGTISRASSDPSPPPLSSVVRLAEVPQRESPAPVNRLAEVSIPPRSPQVPMPQFGTKDICLTAPHFKEK